MILAQKFNTHFSSRKIEDMMLQLVMTSTYGSNSFCFTKAARLMLPTNDGKGQPAQQEFTLKQHLGV